MGMFSSRPTGRWITSYVADDKICCVHETDDEDAIREHACALTACSISFIRRLPRESPSIG